MGDLIHSINNQWNVYSDGSGNLAGNLTVSGSATVSGSSVVTANQTGSFATQNYVSTQITNLTILKNNAEDNWNLYLVDPSDTSVLFTFQPSGVIHEYRLQDDVTKSCIIDLAGTYSNHPLAYQQPHISGFAITGSPQIGATIFYQNNTPLDSLYYPLTTNPSGFLLTGNLTTDVSFRDISGRELDLTSFIQLQNNQAIRSRLAVGTPVTVLIYNSSNQLLIGANNEIKTNGSVALQPPSGGNITASVSGGGVGSLVGPWSLSGNTLITNADTGALANSFVNFGQTGSAFYPRSGNPSGYVTSSQTGVYQDSGRNRISTLASSYVANFGAATGDNWYRVALTNVGAGLRFSALVDVSTNGGTTTPCTRLFDLSHDWISSSAITLRHSTLNSAHITDYRLVRNTGTQQMFFDVYAPVSFSAGDAKISIINTDAYSPANSLFATFSGANSGFAGVLGTNEVLEAQVSTRNRLWEASLTNNSGIFTMHTNSGMVAPAFVSSVAVGTKPITVASTTLCNNLNVELLSGQAGAFYLNVANHVGTGAYYPRTGNPSGFITGSTGGFVSATQTGQFVTLVDNREEVANGLVTLNGPIVYGATGRPRVAMGADSSYYPNVAFYNFDNITTGAWVLNTPIPRTSNTQFQIRVQGHGTNSAGGLTGNIDMLTFGYMQAAISGSIDGLPGAIFPDHCSIRNNSSLNVPVWLGVNTSGNLALAFGDTGTKFYFWRAWADAAIVWNNNTGRYLTGWSWSVETGANFGWGDRKQFSGFQQHLHDATQIAAGVLPSGRLVGNYPQITGLGTLPALTVNGPMTLSGFTPVTKNDTGALANSFVAFNQTGQFVGTGETRSLVFTNATITTLNSSTGTFTTLNVGASLSVTGPAAFNGATTVSGYTVITNNDSGQFYPRNNPSGYVTSTSGGIQISDGDTRYIRQGFDLASGQNNNELILFNNDIGYTGFYFDGVYQRVGAYYLFDTYSLARIDLGGTLSSGKQMISGFHMSGITGNFTGLQVQGQRVITIVDSGSFMALDESRGATWRGTNFIRGSTTVTGATLTVQNGNFSIPGIGTFGVTGPLTFSQPISVTGTLSMSGNRVVCVNETGILVGVNQTGALSNSFVNFGQTGSSFYPRSGNPSGYLTNATNTGNGSGIINAISSAFVAQVKSLTTGNGIKILGTSSELQVNVNLNYMQTGLLTEIDLDTGLYSDLVSGTLGSGIWSINSTTLIQKSDASTVTVYSRLITGTGGAADIIGGGMGNIDGLGLGSSGYVTIPTTSIIFTTGTQLRLQAWTNGVPARALPYCVTNMTASGITGVPATKFTAVKIG